MGRGPRDQHTDRVRRAPGPGSVVALSDLIGNLADERGSDGAGPLSVVVDTVVGAQRLAGWALWIELAAIARLITVWRGAPPILDERLGADPCEASDPSLAARLQQVIWRLELEPRPLGIATAGHRRAGGGLRPVRDRRGDRSELPASQTTRGCRRRTVPDRSPSSDRGASAGRAAGLDQVVDRSVRNEGAGRRYLPRYSGGE